VIGLKLSLYQKQRRLIASVKIVNVKIVNVTRNVKTENVNVFVKKQMKLKLVIVKIVSVVENARRIVSVKENVVNNYEVY